MPTQIKYGKINYVMHKINDLDALPGIFTKSTTSQLLDYISTNPHRLFTPCKLR